MANPRNRRPGGASARSGAPTGHGAAGHGGGHGHDDEKVPPVTTPQGYQTYGVGNQHEERDTNLGAVLGWFGRLVAITLAANLVVWLGWEAWQNYSRRQDTLLPSPLFAAPQVPPEPRVLPQPASDPNGPHADLFYPSDLAHQEREAQSTLLQKYGLEDTDGRAQLPGEAVKTVTGNRGGAVPAPVSLLSRPTSDREPSTAELSEPMPSLSSGGTAEENRLR